MKLSLPCLFAGAALALLVAGCTNGPHVRASGGSAALAPETPAYAKGGTSPNAPYSVIDSQPKLVVRNATLATDLAHAEPCTASQLAVSEVAANLEDNHRSATLGFVNLSDAPCKIGGYPEIKLLDKHNQTVANVDIEKVSATSLVAGVASGAVPAASTTPTTAEVLLAPRSEADFQIGWTTGESCPEIAQILVAAPGTHHTFVLHRRIAICAGPIQITALQPGGVS
jgi:hypothetical protein